MKTVYCAIVLLILIVAGCGGWRYGVASIPYVEHMKHGPEADEGTEPTAESEKINLPGVELSISLNNRVRTSDFAVMLFVVPIHVDPRDTPSFTETDKLTVRLSVVPAEPDFVFDPSRVRLTVDGKEFGPISTRLFDGEIWRKATQSNWDSSWAYDKEKLKAYWQSNPFAVDDPELSSNPVEREVAFAKKKHYAFTIVFDIPVPTPDRDIGLDLGSALLHPKLPRIPMIRFREVRWKQGYS